MAVNDEAREREARELNQAPAHVVGCVCSECRARQAQLDCLLRGNERRTEAREAAQREAGVPAEVRKREAAEAAAAVAGIEAETIGRVRDKLKQGIAHATARAERVATLYRSRERFAKEDAAEFFGASQRIAELSARDQQLAKLQRKAEKRAEGARVVIERDAYGKGSPHSWIADVLAARADAGDNPGLDTPSRGDGEHRERLQRHGACVVRALQGRTKYGRMIERQWAEGFRSANVDENRRVVEKMVREYRTGITTGGGATASAAGGGAAAFVAPELLLSHFATYRSPDRVVADQLNRSVALPPHGLTCYVPQITAGTSVTTTVEGSALSEADPTMGFVSGSVVEKSGMVSISQAVLDRVGPGVTADQFLVAQLKDQLGAAIDAVAINALLSSPNTTTNSTATFALTSASGAGGFYKDLREAKKGTIDTAGTRIHASHLFVPSDFADFIEAWADAQGRPVFEPHYDGTAGELAPGYSGYRVQSLEMWSDDNLPLSGSDFQLIVTQPQYTLLLEGTPTFSIVPQYGAGNLEPVIRVNCYVAAIARYPQAVSTLTGAFYAQSNFA